MKHVSAIFLLSIGMCGCHDSANIVAPSNETVLVTFISGFTGDSIITKCDTLTLPALRVYSDSVRIGGTSGWEISVREGFHHLTINLPELKISQDTMFTVFKPNVTEIDVSLDRTKRLVGFQIYSY